MKISYPIQRPSLIPAACAPLSAAHLPVGTVAAPRPWALQVQVPTELVGVLTAGDGSNGITGFRASNGIDSASKRMTDGARGVPPRGRPV